MAKDLYNVRSTLKVGKKNMFTIVESLEEQGIGEISRLPFSIKVLLEAAIRQYDGKSVTQEHIEQLAKWTRNKDPTKRLPLNRPGLSCKILPVSLQSWTWRHSFSDGRVGGDPKRINPLIPVDLVIDHSVMVDRAGTKMHWNTT